MSGVQLTAAGHVDQNSSAYLGHSFAAIWELPNLVHVPRSGRLDADLDERSFKLASFKEDQRPNRCNAASHVGAAVLVHVARSGQLDAALR